MEENKPSFEAITNGLFSETEQAAIEEQARVRPYTTEPILPTCQELLEVLDAMFDTFLELKVAQQWDLLTEEFADRITAVLGIHSDDELMVRNPRSFLSESGLGVLDNGANIFGDFAKLTIYPWYDLPFREDAVSEIEQYARDDGLHVMIRGAILELPDESHECIGEVLVPFNHGYPEWYRVLRTK